MQLRQWPQPTAELPATLSPGARPPTPSPTASTVPAHSCPMMKGHSGGHMGKNLPEMMPRSVPQMATPPTRQSTSAGPAPGTGTSRIS